MLQVMDMENKDFKHRSLGPDFFTLDCKNEWAVPGNLTGELTLRLRQRFQRWVRSLRSFYVKPKNFSPCSEFLKVNQIFPPMRDEIYQMVKWWKLYHYHVDSTPLGPTPLSSITQAESSVFKKPSVSAAPPTTSNASRRKRHTQPKITLVDLLAKTPKF